MLNLWLEYKDLIITIIQALLIILLFINIKKLFNFVLCLIKFKKMKDYFIQNKFHKKIIVTSEVINEDYKPGKHNLVTNLGIKGLSYKFSVREKAYCPYF